MPDTHRASIETAGAVWERAEPLPTRRDGRSVACLWEDRRGSPLDAPVFNLNAEKTVSRPKWSTLDIGSIPERGGWFRASQVMRRVDANTSGLAAVRE
jgi:hypothetical protein